MKGNRIYLTGVGEVLKKEAEKKLDDFDTESEPKCDNGHNAEFYDGLGMDYPEELIKRLKIKNGSADIPLADEDFEEVYADIVVYENDIKFFMTDSSGTTVFLHEGVRLTVLETADQIDEYLDYIHRPWLIRMIDNIQYFFSTKQ